MINDLQDFFWYGMKRKLPTIAIPPPHGIALNLGSGNQIYDDVTNLDLPQWNADIDNLPFNEGTVCAIYAFHFLEHLNGTNVVRILRECERVMKPGAVMNIVVPFWNSQLAVEDLDHKSYWTEDTWKTLFHNQVYDKMRGGPWKLEIGINVIMGIVHRNLSLFTQLIRKV